MLVCSGTIDLLDAATGPAMDWEQVAKRALSDLVVARDALESLKQMLRFAECLAVMLEDGTWLLAPLCPQDIQCDSTMLLRAARRSG